jgi:hypothetical protein
MIYFQTKKPNLGKLWMALECKGLVYSMAIWIILRPYGKEKSGKPATMASWHGGAVSASFKNELVFFF